MVTLAPNPPRGLTDAPLTEGRVARSRRRDRPARATSWWAWFDFDSKLHAQIWFITCTQIVVLVVGALVIHASSASPY